MKSLVFLVLLLCLCERSVQEVDRESQGQDHGQGNEEHGESLNLCNACSELKELRDMVIEQRLGMQMLQQKLNEQAAELKSTQEELQQQKFDHQILNNELQQLKSDHQALKNEVQQLKSNQETLRTELETVRMENSAQTSQITVFESRMVHVEKTLEDNANQPKVAFSVGLTDSGSLGPFNTDTPLVYENVFYNMGEAYNSVNGIFTAPAKGVYYFTFTVYNGGGSSTGVKMYHNQKMLRFNYSGVTGYIYHSNANLVQMEEGDVVYMRLASGYRVHDSSYNHSSFTGFLLHTL